MTPVDLCDTAQAGTLPLDRAIGRLLAAVQPIAGSEYASVNGIAGRVLAGSAQSPIDLPPHTNAAMDGYAVRSIDTGAGATLKITGTSWAGRPFEGALEQGQAVRIFTGAVVPEGADAVVPQEDVQRDGDEIAMAESAAPGTCVRSRGEEFRRGQELLPAGRILSAADIGLLASAGIAKVQVNRRIKVAYCSTGDELTPPGQPLEAGKIYESNRYMLSALLAELGAESTDLGVLPDRFDDLVAALESAAASADAIVSTGGASVGEADYVVRALEQCGKVEFWKVAIKPGKPFAFGRIGSAWYFGLPGNPVAVIVTFQQLVAPTLRRLMGAHPSTPLRFSAVAADRIKKSRGRMEFQRGIYHRRADGSFQVVSLENQGSHRLSSVTEANCFIVLPAENQGVAAGELVEIEPFSTRL